MSFFDNLSKAGSMVGKGLNKLDEKNQEIQQLMSEYESYSDEKLLKIGKTDIPSAKMLAARKVLTSRGYSIADIRNS